MKHAGIHWPENAGGEHPSRDAIIAMPGMAGATLICSPSARYHYDYIRRQQPSAIVVWRAIPRQGKLPAQLGWDGKRVADECLNLWDEQPHGGIEWFTPLNELQFLKEAGEMFRGYGYVAAKLAGIRIALQDRFRALGQNVRLVFPAWVPQDDGTFLDDWRHEAEQWDAVGLHCYGSAETMQERYQSYRGAFPGKPLFVGEWNSNHEDHDENASLEMWAEVANTDPLFLGATYYIWETNNAGERDLSIWGNPDRLALFRDPPIAAPVPPIEPPVEVPAPMNDIETFIRDAAVKRGIDPDIAVRVAQSEGGIKEYAARGTFDTGSSWWPFQLHYGGAGYEYLGTVAGMGNGFTKLTGWQPGDPAAWRDSVRYALNRAKASGWTPWYGAAHVGIDQWDGIDRNHPWEAAGEVWDYESGEKPVPEKVTYNPNEPAHPQENSYDCSQDSLEWALWALGRKPDNGWMEATMVAERVMTPDLGLLDATGAGLALFVGRHWGEFGYYANNEASVSWEAIVAEVNPQPPYPILIGGRAWGHWSGLRGYDAARDVLLLANPSDGWQGVGQIMSRAQWANLGPFSIVRVLHPDLLGEAAPPVVVPPVVVEPPIVLPPADTRIERARELLRQALAVLDEPAA